MIKARMLAKKLIGVLKQCLNQGLPDRQVAERVLHVIQPFRNGTPKVIKARMLAKKLIGVLKQCLNQGLPDRQVAERVLHVIQPFSDAPKNGKGRREPQPTQIPSFYSQFSVMLEEEESQKTPGAKEQGDQPPIVSFTISVLSLSPLHCRETLQSLRTEARYKNCKTCGNH